MSAQHHRSHVRSLGYLLWLSLVVTACTSSDAANPSADDAGATHDATPEDTVITEDGMAETDSLAMPDVEMPDTADTIGLDADTSEPPDTNDISPDVAVDIDVPPEDANPADTDDGETPLDTDAPSDTEDSPDAEPADVGETDGSGADVNNPPDTDESDDTAVSPSLCPPLPDDAGFELSLHTVTASGALGDELLPGDETEIVQGPQGGVHIEFGYRVSPDDTSETKVFASFEGETYVTPGADPVGLGSTALTVLFLSPGGGGYDSQENLVIFEQNEAFHYEGKPCCAMATVSLLDPATKEPVATASAAVELFCVDIFQ